jgi:hypothetical protein
MSCTRAQARPGEASESARVWHSVISLPESRPFYTRQSLCRVLHSAKNTRQIFYRQTVLCRVLFSDTWQRLYRVSKNTRQINNRKKIQKTAKLFLNYRNNSPTTTYYHTHRTIIFHYYFEYMFCEWWDSNSKPLSRTYTLPLHYYINYVYITFSFLMHYNKPRVIWLFKTINEFIWKCDQL